MIDFEGQVVIVTGAGRGLGRLYALEVARRGGAVVVNDLGSTMGGEGSDASVADQVALEIERAGGVAVASHDSVASPEGGEAIVRCAVDRFGRLDAVVSNAGIFHTVDFDELAAKDWQRMLNVHLDCSFHLSQPAFPVHRGRAAGAGEARRPHTPRGRRRQEALRLRPGLRHDRQHHEAAGPGVLDPVRQHFEMRTRVIQWAGALVAADLHDWLPVTTGGNHDDD